MTTITKIHSVTDEIVKESALVTRFDGSVETVVVAKVTIQRKQNGPTYSYFTVTTRQCDGLLRTSCETTFELDADPCNIEAAYQAELARISNEEVDEAFAADLRNNREKRRLANEEADRNKAAADYYETRYDENNKAQYRVHSLAQYRLWISLGGLGSVEDFEATTGATFDQLNGKWFNVAHNHVFIHNA